MSVLLVHANIECVIDSKNWRCHTGCMLSFVLLQRTCNWNFEFSTVSDNFMQHTYIRTKKWKEERSEIVKHHVLDPFQLCINKKKTTTILNRHSKCEHLFDQVHDTFTFFLITLCLYHVYSVLVDFTEWKFEKTTICSSDIFFSLSGLLTNGKCLSKKKLKTDTFTMCINRQVKHKMTIQSYWKCCMWYVININPSNISHIVQPRKFGIWSSVFIVRNDDYFFGFYPKFRYDFHLVVHMVANCSMSIFPSTIDLFCSCEYSIQFRVVRIEPLRIQSEWQCTSIETISTHLTAARHLFCGRKMCFLCAQCGF